MEFHVSRSMRDKCNFDLPMFSTNGNVIFSQFKNVRLFAQKLNDVINPVTEPKKYIKSGQLNAMGLIDEIFHIVCQSFRDSKNKTVFSELLTHLETNISKEALDTLLLDFTNEFPPLTVYRKEISEQAYLSEFTDEVSNRESTLEELVLLILANENPAFEPFYVLFNDEKLQKNTYYKKSWKIIQDFFKKQPLFGPNHTDLISMLREPINASPYNLKGQLDYIRQSWQSILGEHILKLLSSMDMITEEEKPGWSGHFSGPPPMEAYNYDSLMKEYERFSPDKDWMGNVVLMAKTVLVWLDQLSKQYKYEITRLDQIPDEELDSLAQQGFTSLWLIGIWERSWASKRIKQINGNPEATSSAYSLHDYEIAENLGGWSALENLRQRLWYRGIRIAADMVPNHTAMDSKWIVEKPHLFIQSHDCPFPTYTFNGENVSLDPRISVYLEDRYYSKTDCAVVYKRVDNQTGDTRYLYHGNDGTGMPWNDTAQIDFLNPEAREEVIQKILHVARNFSVIRFDAAMVLAKKHIRRLWFPAPGQGGDIASRSEHAISNEAFEAAIPNEFWREVVDRIATEIPDTLLLAEAFWMMEGYFVRTLGMHRVYNSAFMNMLKKEENSKYRSTIKNTIEFDPQILKRFVNFMNNPDEETAVAQFGKGDKYFGVCTLMVTMPGLPMFGHGQIEGYGEKYGMEYTKAYWNEEKDFDLIDRHSHDIFPLMKKRYLFSDVQYFRFYDVWAGDYVNENVFAYSNKCDTESCVVFYNNAYDQMSGWISNSCNFAVKTESGDVTMHTEHIAHAIGLSNSSKHYCIFREKKSDLWYIRSSAELYEKGIYLHLNGYEYQILLDISEVEDDDTGMYHVLCKELNGRGVQDIDVALKEVFLKDLYHSLEKFASPEFFEGIAQLCTPHLFKKNKEKGAVQKKPITLSKLLAQAKPAGIEYFNMLEIFIGGNYGSSTVLNVKKRKQSCDTELVWSSFVKRLTKLIKLCENAKASKDESSELIITLYENILSHPYMCEILGGFCILFTLKDVLGKDVSACTTRNLIQLWCLERKMRDILVSMGKPSKDMYNQFKVMLSIAEFCDKTIKPAQLDNVAWEMMTKFVSGDLASSILGINRFNGTLWFNREAAQETISYAAILYTLFRAKTQDYPAIMKLWKTILSAIDASEYKIENLLSILSPKKTVKKKSVNKDKKGKE